MRELRTVFLGNDRWSAVALEEAMRGDPPLVPSLVVTRVPRPAGRGSRLRPTAVADAAHRLGLPLIEVATVRGGTGQEAIEDIEPDLLVVVAYGEILPGELLRVPSIGSVNLHFSLLPRWRGASPVQRTIEAGDAVAGVTTMLMDEGLDTGPVLEQRSIEVAGTEDAGSLGARLASIGGALLVRTVAGLRDGSVVPAAQPAEGVTYAPKLLASERRVDWGLPAPTIDRLVRALSPTPGATTTFRGETLRIVRGEPRPGHGPPGALTVPGRSEDGVRVGTGDGLYRLLEVVPAGRKPMRATGWAHGARFGPDEHLGSTLDAAR
jgi:methionyl-tRNA formyltransferase